MIGRTLGHYRIEERLGSGGMGAVYRARDTRLDRPVAIKVIADRRAADPRAHDLLVREARTASALNHPSICTIHEVNQEEGQTWIVMEHIEGTLLDALIPASGLPVETVLRLGAEIADALAHAHDRGVVHRDLKPANVIVRPDGRAKVLDFGLALRVAQGGPEEITQSLASMAGPGAVAGTLPYVAPEVLGGEPADARSDLWSLGVLLHEAAAGSRPFGGRTAFEISSAILREEPAPLPARVPEGLRAVIRRCLSKEPGRRYQTAGELRAALEAIQSAGVTAGAAAAEARAPERPARRRGARSGTARSSGARRSSGRTKVPRIRSLAVLPLDNLSGDPAQDYFADGMTDALIASLATVGTLKVISRTSVMRYKGARRPLPEIARELKVDAVVEGTVIRSGERVRITAQLIQASTDRHLWAQTYDRDLRDILALQSEVARAVVGEIRVTLTPQESARLAGERPVDPAAYEAYLMGRHAWNKRSEEDMRRAIGHFQQAVDRDPAWAPAHAGLADCYNILGFWGSLPPQESYPRAIAAARRAAELDATLGEAHASLGYAALHYDHDWAEAGRQFDEALRLNPGWATTHHWHALVHASLGRIDQALDAIHRARDLDPLAQIIRAAEAWILYFGRRFDEAAARARDTLDLAPGFWPAVWALGLAQLGQGRHDDAVASMRRAADLSPASPHVKGAVGQALARAGRADEAHAVLADLRAQGTGRYVRPADLAAIHAALGEIDAAIDCLGRAIDEGGNWLNYLRVDPAFDPLVSDPRYRAMLARIYEGSGT